MSNGILFLSSCLRHVLDVLILRLVAKVPSSWRIEFQPTIGSQSFPTGNLGHTSICQVSRDAQILLLEQVDHVGWPWCHVHLGRCVGVDW